MINDERIRQIEAELDAICQRRKELVEDFRSLPIESDESDD